MAVPATNSLRQCFRFDCGQRTNHVASMTAIHTDSSCLLADCLTFRITGRDEPAAFYRSGATYLEFIQLDLHDSSTHCTGRAQLQHREGQIRAEPPAASTPPRQGPDSARAAIGGPVTATLPRTAHRRPTSRRDGRCMALSATLSSRMDVHSVRHGRRAGHPVY